MQFRYSRNRRTRVQIVIILIIFAVIAYGFFFPLKKSSANEITLFPSICEGNWFNATEAAGDPATDQIANGARSTGVGETISCHSFEGDHLPEGVTITSAHLEFQWEMIPIAEPVPAPSIEESYDPLPSDQPEAQVQSGEVKINEGEADVNSPEVESGATENSKPTDSPVTPEPTLEPTSRLPRWFETLIIPMAHAEETVTDPEIKLPLAAESVLEPGGEIIPVEINSQSLEELKQIRSPSEAPFFPAEGEITTSIPAVESSELIITPPSLMEEENVDGTPLYSIATSFPPQVPFTLGSVKQEALDEVYPLDISFPAIHNLRVSLTSLLTIDSMDELTLRGVKLVVAFKRPEIDDPIRQPDLTVDTILDDIRSEEMRVIRIRRADNNESEIWYRSLVVEEKEVPKKTEEETSDRQIASLNFPTPVTEPILEAESTTYSSASIEPLLPFVENSETSVTKTTERQVSPTETQRYFPSMKDNSWNFVVGHNFSNESASIGFKDGIIFWIDQNRKALYSFNTLTQGTISRSYDSEQGDNYIPYFSATSEEKKAIFDLSTEKFIFLE